MSKPDKLPPRAILRRVLQSVLRTDSELDAFCGDHLPEVASRFTNGMDRIAKINMILVQESNETILETLKQFVSDSQLGSLIILQQMIEETKDSEETEQGVTCNQLRAVLESLENSRPKSRVRSVPDTEERSFQKRRISRLSLGVTTIGLISLPVSSFGASLTSSNYQKMFLTMSTMGGLYVLFGLFFANISKFPERHRARVLGALIGAFILVTLMLGARAAGFFYRGKQKSSSSASQHDVSMPDLIEVPYRESAEDLALATDLTVIEDHAKQKIIGMPSSEHPTPKPIKTQECPEPTSEEIESERMRLVTALSAYKPSVPPSLPLNTLKGLVPAISPLTTQIPKESILDGGSPISADEPPDLESSNRGRIPSREEIANYLKAAGCGPKVLPGIAEVRGSLDKELIRRIIAMHRNELNHCYERGRLLSPTLSGRVLVSFTISTTGNVIASMVLSSTMEAPVVEQCIAHAIRSWTFSKPQGGIVVVNYHFEFPEDRKQDIAEKELISHIIQRHHPELRFCMQTARIREPSLGGGVMKVRLLVSKNGSVDSAHLISSTVSNEEVKLCVLNALRRWDFSTSANNEKEIVYPIKLY